MASNPDVPRFYNPIEQTKSVALRADRAVNRFIDRAMTRMNMPEDPQLRCLVAFGLLTVPVFVLGTAAVLAAGRLS